MYGFCIWFVGISIISDCSVFPVECHISGSCCIAFYLFFLIHWKVLAKMDCAKWDNRSKAVVITELNKNDHGCRNAIEFRITFVNGLS